MAAASSDITVMLQNDALPSSSDVLQSLWFSDSSPSFHRESRSCSASMVNFDNVRLVNPEKEENGNDDDYDGACFHQPEKKRRLTADQVQFLERNFEVENKLEPERKAQLAKELGLQPRQVAIWFQNRRARFKTKQLEKDHDSLKASYDRLKNDYDGLLKEKEKLRNEVRLLTEKLLLRGKEKSDSEPMSPAPALKPQKQIPKAGSEFKSMGFFKQEEATSAKSDVLDSESSHCTEGNHGSMPDPADSSQACGRDQSDFSQDEEDDLARTLFPCLPKLEDGCYGDPPANCSNWSLPMEGHPSWFWPY